jgi:hypothetical protein
MLLLKSQTIAKFKYTKRGKLQGLPCFLHEFGYLGEMTLKKNGLINF